MAKRTFANEKEAKDYTATLIKTWRRDPAKLEEFAKFAERNSYRYSMKNTMLIMAQNDGAILCQSFGAWGKTKYSGANGKEATVRINKGQHGMKIWTPVQYCMVDIDGDGKFETRLADCTAEQKKLVKSGDIKSRKGMSFKLGSTFDIAQTDYPAELYPSILNRGTESVDHAAAFEALVRYGKNVSIPFTSGNSFLHFRYICSRCGKTVSIPFTSGNSFLPRGNITRAGRARAVSIPFTSGNSFLQG